MKDSKKSGKAAGFFKWIGRDIADIGVTFKEGDWKTRISYLIMGFGPLMRKMYARGIAFLALEAAFIWYMVAFGWDYLAKFTTLGTVETGIDMKTGLRVYGDNSFMILLYGLLTIVLLLLFIFVWRMNIRENRNEEQKLKEGHPLPCWIPTLTRHYWHFRLQEFSFLRCCRFCSWSALHLPIMTIITRLRQSFLHGWDLRTLKICSVSVLQVLVPHFSVCWDGH